MVVKAGGTKHVEKKCATCGTWRPPGEIKCTACAGNDAEAEKRMGRALTAKERTVPLLAPEFRHELVMPEMTLDGPRVRRVRLGLTYGTHYHHVDTKAALCGLDFTIINENDRGSPVKVCVACRAEASRLQAVVW